jgi:hypothetical protein
MIGGFSRGEILYLFGRLSAPVTNKEGVLNKE